MELYHKKHNILGSLQKGSLLLSDEEIDDLLVLDVKDDSYFSNQGVTNQHGQGGGLFVEDDVVMGWLLGK